VWHNLVRGVRIAWDASPRRFVTVATVSMLTALLAPVLIWYGKHLVDLIVLGRERHVVLADIAPSVGMLALLFGADRALSTYRENMQELFARAVEQHASQKLLEKAATVDVGHHDDPTFHDRMEHARREVGWRPHQLTFSTIGLATSLISVAGLFGLLASLHPLLVVLSLVSLLPSVAIQRSINRKLYDFWFDTTTEERERWYARDMASQPTMAKELRSFGAGGYFLARYQRITDERYAKLSLLYRRATLLAVIAGLGTGIALALAYGFVGARGLAGELTPGDLTAAIGGFTAITSQASLISGSLLSIEQHARFLDDYFAFLAVEPLVKTPAAPRALPEPLRPGIAVEGVRFSYPHSGREALKGLDLEVKPGELIALVGDNGAGKTTIVNLLSRFYDPTSGRVTIGGVDLRDVDPIALRARMGVLFQDFAKYQLTLRENVQLGRVERDAGDAEIVAALEAARAKFLLDKLAKGLDARVGRLFQGGHELSGGEWQRLAVARLMFRRADIWILDEPTSNLDPEAEAAIFAELKQQLAGRMAIVISHRFSTVRVADRIYVVADGRVLETGTHEQLIAAKGRYAELFEIQAAGYR